MRPTTLLLATATLLPYCAHALLFVSVADLPQCGQTCVNSAFNSATNLGCPPTAAEAVTSCLCDNQNFHNSIGDCTQRFCSNQDEVNTVISWVATHCHPAGLAARSVSASIARSTSSISSSRLSSSASGLTSSTSSRTATKSSSSLGLSGALSSSTSTIRSTLITSTITPSASSIKSTTTTTPTPSTSSSPIPTPTALPIVSQGLSTSTKAGLAGGIGGGALALGSIIFVVWHHARKSRRAHEAHNVARRSMSTTGFDEHIPVLPYTTNKSARKPLMQEEKIAASNTWLPVGVVGGGGGYIYSELPNPSSTSTSTAATATATPTMTYEMSDTGIPITSNQAWTYDGRTQERPEYHSGGYNNYYYPPR